MDIREIVKGSKSKYEVSIMADGKRVILRTVDIEVEQVDCDNQRYIL